MFTEQNSQMFTEQNSQMSYNTFANQLQVCCLIKSIIGFYGNITVHACSTISVRIYKVKITENAKRSLELTRKLEKLACDVA